MQLEQLVSNHKGKGSTSEAYNLLREIGLTDRKIASCIALLGFDPDILRRNYQNLRKIGLTKKKISTMVRLLGSNPETIRENRQELLDLGLTEEKIASRAELLGRDIEVIKSNYRALKRLGLSDKNIASYANLLSLNPKTVRNHYQNLRRYLDREIILEYSSLLGNNPNTIDASVQFLYQLGVDYKKHIFLLGMTNKTKRKKIAWFAKNVLHSDLADDRKSVVKRAREIFSENPDYFKKNIKWLERLKGKYK